MTNFNIEDLVKSEAPNELTSDHDRVYAGYLREAFKVYCGMTRQGLVDSLRKAQRRYNGSHASVAECVVLYQLIKHENLKRFNKRRDKAIAECIAKHVLSKHDIRLQVDEGYGIERLFIDEKEVLLIDGLKADIVEVENT